MSVNITNKLTLNPGSKGKLIAEITPANATRLDIFWTTSDNNVVKLFNIAGGVEVSAINPGTADITVVVQQYNINDIGNQIYARSFADTCVVTVFDQASNGTTSDIPTQITKDGFAGWYIPDLKNYGVKNNVPRFAQMNPGPCLGYSIMMGDYYLRYRKTYTPTTFFNTPPNTYFDEKGFAQWVNVSIQSSNSDFNELKIVLKNQLDLGKPVVVSGRTNRTDGGTNYDHFVLVVAYINSGNNKSDFIVIDPLSSQPFPTTYADFRIAFPKDTAGTNTTRPIYTFNSNYTS